MDFNTNNSCLKLFKYRQGEPYDIENLNNNDLLFRHPLDFNDPYDSLINIQTIQIRRLVLNNSLQIGIHNFASLYSTAFKLWFDEIQKEFDDGNTLLQKYLRVACFSECNDSILMWSHYANYHKGFCLEYDYEELNTYFEPYGGINPAKYINNIESFGADKHIIDLLKYHMNREKNNINEELMDVINKLICEDHIFKYDDRRDIGKKIMLRLKDINCNYLKETLEFFRDEYEMLEKYADYQVKKLPLFKFDDWKYEKEWRVILYKDSRLLKQDKKLNIRDMEQQEHNKVIPIFVKIPKPTAIYLGCKAEKELQDQLERFCLSLKIPLYKMRLNKSKFKLEPILVSSFLDDKK